MDQTTQAFDKAINGINRSAEGRFQHAGRASSYLADPIEPSSQHFSALLAAPSFALRATAMTYPLSDSFCSRFNCSKPDLPYIVGTVSTVRSHNSPPPTSTRCDCWLTSEAAYETESMHPLDRCIKHPPLAGSDGATTAELKIVGAVRIGDYHSAQLVTVQILHTSFPNVLPTDTNLLAKIYDLS
ncbi:hypothetical protein GX51_01620 [Blastomyces parvus]|uniref:Uncharacterized protein n=1 Tax=Blastomyces parvus TaxID=2060905 RepID=A0A2B7XFY0_9EURO|nr:hypothetical protein GX51_01620 [Blastomyces parvus]